MIHMKASVDLAKLFPLAINRQCRLIAVYQSPLKSQSDDDDLPPLSEVENPATEASKIE